MLRMRINFFYGYLDYALDLIFLTPFLRAVEGYQRDLGSMARQYDGFLSSRIYMEIVSDDFAKVLKYFEEQVRVRTHTEEKNPSK